MSGTAVVYVHGLWLNGWESLLLRHRISRHLGCATLPFTYSSVGASLGENVHALAGFLERVPAERLHLVGHSMGGLLIIEMFETVRALPPGRVVLLGSPAQGSRAARNLAGWSLGRRIMGRMAHEVLLPMRNRRWSTARDLGVIAGSRAVGLGRLVSPLDEPSDGTVLVSETRVEGAKEHLTVRTTHSGMMYSHFVAHQVVAFLRDGRFARSTARYA
jgi:pimeloyl-ACP methyl ester carboxylesterase